MRAWLGGRATLAVTAIMELREACFFVLFVHLVFGKGISNVTHEVRKIETCPDEGYFFRRDPSPNQVAAGTCWLCFCQEPGVAHCWERDQRRCDVEKFHYHRIGRQVSRNRRSFSDIFFRDSARDFFNKNLPKQCKPNESFSDGCPPADWCLGCTVCDCDSSGRWDCHILSFCDGKEHKKKLKPYKQKPGRRDVVDYDNSKEVKKRRGKKPINKSNTKPTANATNKATLKKTANFKKVVQAKLGNKPNKLGKNPKKVGKKPQKLSKLENKTKKVGNKPNKLKKQGQNNKQPKRPNQNSKNLKGGKIQVRRKPQNKSRTIKMPQNQKKQKHIKNASKVKIIKKIGAPPKPVQLHHNAIKGKKINPNNNETIKIGQKIVKQVLTAFQKIIRKEIDKIEGEHKQKLADGLDCGKLHKRDKRTYNERSKAASRNKNKYSKQGLVKENYTNSRHKREIINKEIMNVEKVSVITLSTEVNAVIPLDPVTKNISAVTNSVINLTITPNFTPLKDDYYRYSIKNYSTGFSTTESVKKMLENYEREILDNNIIPMESKNKFFQKTTKITSESNVSKNDTNSTMGTIRPGLKVSMFSDLLQTKLNKNKQRKPVSRLLISIPSVTQSYYVKSMEYTHYPSKTSELNSKNTEITKKCKTNRYVSQNSDACCLQTSKRTNKTDVTGLRNILEGLFGELDNKTNANKTHPKRRKLKSNVSVLKYIRKFFHKLFTKKRSKSHKIYGLGTAEDHTLQLLCENIGPCKIRRNNRMMLKYKLNLLNKETKTVLKSIRILKGLLHLFELPYGDKFTHTVNSSLQNDIKKLGIILKDYKNYDTNMSLSFTQKQQIDYIKKNTETFIDSVKTFADILTDILAIITPPFSYDHNLLDTLPNQQLTTLSPAQFSQTEENLNKIKNILYKYNIMQNTFMKRMYDLINGVEIKAASTTTEKTRILTSLRNANTTNTVIEKYSKNIIESLRRLKTIAHILNSKRKKRELIMKDDALDYILTLMEFLIRQNHPLESPAKDGIDLLLDAIKNAPDVKPINKELWDYAPIAHPSRKINKIQNSNTEISENDSNSDSIRVSNEVNQAGLEDNAIMQDNYFRVTSKTRIEDPILQAVENDVTQKVYYRAYFDSTETDNVFDPTTEYNIMTKKRSNEQDDKIGFEKFESYIGDVKKFQVSNNEDDQVGDNTTDNELLKVNSTNVAEEDQAKHLSTNLEPTPSPIILQGKESSSESDDSAIDTIDKKTKLDWIEETFDREIREFSNLANNATKRTPTRTSARLITSTSTAKSAENVSGLTKETEKHFEGRVTRKKGLKNNTGNDEVLIEKQMQFLNSLDYGTEKSADFEQSDSKEDVRPDDGEYFV